MADGEKSPVAEGGRGIGMDTVLQIVDVLAVAVFGWMMIGVSLNILGIWREPPPSIDSDERPSDFPRPKTEDCTPTEPR